MNRGFIGALSTSVATALLAGCGGSQAPIGAPAAFSQSGHIGLSSSYHVLYSFSGHPDGAHAEASLINVKGTLYGTTAFGGKRRAGAIFSVSATGKQKILYSFGAGTDGADPVTGLIDVDGTLYGTTYAGGGSGCYKKRGCGTVFSVTPDGSEAVLYRFKGGNGGEDGKNPNGLIAVNGILYGTTELGGARGQGTVYSVTTTGTEKVLYSFLSGSDGAYPRAGLIDVKGTLYGTTSLGGTMNYGTFFSISKKGVEKVLYSFKGGYDGLYPAASLINLSGTLYGTTVYGGNSDCTANSCGTVFSVTTTGVENVLYRFQGPFDSDGGFPFGGLIAVDGMLYGTTYEGGHVGSGCFSQNGCGTVFSMTPSGTKNLQYSLNGDDDGALPTAGLVNVKGVLYGTTADGGQGGCYRHAGCGTVFAFKP